MEKSNKAMKLLKKYYAHFFILLLLLIVLVALYFSFVSFHPPMNTTVIPGESIVTRSAVDSTAVLNYNQYTIKNSQPKSSPVDWSAISAAIIATMGMAQVYTNKKSSEKLTNLEDYVGKKFINIFDIIKEFQDDQFKKDVDTKLRQIEYDVSGFVDDPKIRNLIEGITTRTRSFAHDVIQHYFDSNAMTIAENKISARASECRGQVRALGFDPGFQQKIDELRETQIKLLKEELKELAEDNQFNDKYSRFHDIVSRFLKGFTMNVIKLHLQDGER